MLTGAAALCGCAPLDTLNAAGTEAARVAGLFGWMAFGAALIWLLVIGLAFYATHLNRERHDVRLVRWLILGGGVALPTALLGALLSYGLKLMPELRGPAPADALAVAVVGEQWWWRVRYRGPDGEPVELANELRLPLGRPVTLELSSPDVIHSFWVPALAGKLDMVPGRVTQLTLTAEKTGVYRGVCAEYCGSAHALMKFVVVVMEPEAFADWLAQQARPAQAPPSALATRGRAQFLANGCGACHTVRGTPADGRVGPDLTHVGGRLTLGAGILPNDEGALLRWISDTPGVKPGVHMPAFGMLPRPQRLAIVAWLRGLQ